MTTTEASARSYVEMAMVAYPILTHFGFGLFADPHPEPYTEKFHTERENLKNAISEVQMAADWISGIEKIGRYNYDHSSYGYKHLVEKWASKRGARCYISNGSFIAASVGLGFVARRIESTPNARFKFSEASIRKLSVK